MLNIFDWIRRCRNGAELLATLHYFDFHQPNLLPEPKALAGPMTLTTRPCPRCWIYPGQMDTINNCCRLCGDILLHVPAYNKLSPKCIIVWGHVSQIPKQLSGQSVSDSTRTINDYIHDEHHFLVVLPRQRLRNWLQEVLLYDGADVKGLFQVFPTIGSSSRASLDDLLCRAMHYDAQFGMDALRVRFFPDPYMLFSPHIREAQGKLTFLIDQFLSLLEMAHVFRSLLKPEEWNVLKTITTISNKTEKRFAWGRFTGMIKPEARDMLNSWNFEKWSANQINLLYELLDYVTYSI